MAESDSSTRKAKLTVLGCGTSTGVPVPGCKCSVCTSTDPKNKRLRTSSYVSFADGTGLLIDASPDLRAQALRYNIPQVDAVFYTHSHADHILGTDDLRVFNFRRPDPIPCYANEATRVSLERFFDYIFAPNPDYEGGALANLTSHRIEPFQPFTVNGVEILPFELFHGALPVLGLKIGEMAYATDCNSIPERSKEILRGVKYLFLDGLRREPHPTHFTIDSAAEVAQELEAEQTYLIHMTHNVDYEEVNRSLPKGVELAYDGLIVEFSL